MCKSFLIGSVTKVLSYEDLFAVNACEKSERDEKALAVRLEKEYEERIAAKKNAEKVDLVKNAKVEEKKSNEKSEPIKRSREIGDSDEKNRSGNEVTEEIDTIGNPLDGQTGASTIEEQETEMIISGTEKFGESKVFLSSLNMKKVERNTWMENEN